MKRRDFFAASAAAGLGWGLSPTAASAQGAMDKQLLELRTYHFASLDKQKAFEDFLARAAVPALNRAGIQPVGVFKLLKDDNPALKLEADSPDLYILLPHKSFDSVLSMIGRLAADEVFTGMAQATLETAKSDPAYTRFESSLMLAFDSVPKVEVPTKAATRLLQLRIYESHSIERALMKIEMFNEGGEVAIFRKCGMNPVFFGQSLVGSKLPNLTYMLSFESDAAQKEAWDKFLKHPDWVALKGNQRYRDTVSNITNLVLRPSAGSQI
jgi:hypothetical protein